MWQDFVISAGQLIFAIALVPAMLCREKPPRVTCAITGGTLVAYALALASLELWWSAASCAVCALFWIVLLIQRRA